MTALLVNGHALCLPLADESVQCCITSPPYWGLRKYAVEPLTWGGDAGCGHEWGEKIPGCARGGSGTPGKNNYGEGYARGAPRGAWCISCGSWRGNLGHEPTPELFIEHLVAIFREVRRVLRKDGTLWVVIGDSYARDPRKGQKFRDTEKRPWHGQNPCKMSGPDIPPGLKPKDLIGIPWRLAFALQADGWWLRSDIIWAKGVSGQQAIWDKAYRAAISEGLEDNMARRIADAIDPYVGNPMPNSHKDRPVTAHEHVFLLARARRYYYDHEAVKEPGANYERRGGRAPYTAGGAASHGIGSKSLHQMSRGGRNRRTVWEIPTSRYGGKHYAAFPPALVEPMVLAGSRRGDVVLDPFCGTGTVGEVCIEHGRRFVGLDLSMEYLAEMAKERTAEVQVSLGLRELLEAAA